MKTANTIEMAASIEAIMRLAGDVERWPIILPHYRWVKLLDGGGDHKTVEMAARRGRFPVRWRAMQEIEHHKSWPVIRYRHIGGVTKGMNVAWTFAKGRRSIIVRIDHDFTAPWPLVGSVIADRVIGPYFVSAIAGQTLETIKAIVEDRDPRFGVDGQPRS